jgi:SAM-dependent methyltransferase
MNPPAVAAAVRKLNVGCGPDILPAAEGWSNMDIVALPGVDVVHDAFTFPWPFPDGAFDHVLCRHILEHVPHDVGAGRDGFFMFLEECHRILRPGGTLEILTPHPESPNTIIDPTHTRVVHPLNFQYFDPSQSARYAYYTQARFRVKASRVSQRALWATDRWRLGPSRTPLTVHLATRLPFLRRMLTRVPDELHMVLEKA